MDISHLSTVTGLIIVLSVASERLVEIVKGFIPFLNQENSDPKKEGWRHALLQILAGLAGMLTVVLARPAIPTDVYDPSNNLSLVALGLLASGGSGFWNSILTYVTKLKDLLPDR